MTNQTPSKADLVAWCQREKEDASRQARFSAASYYRGIHNSRADILSAIAASLEEGKQDRAKAERLEQAIRTAKSVAHEAWVAWDADKDSRVGKILKALAGHGVGYRADIDAIHAALAPSPIGEAT